MRDSFESLPETKKVIRCRIQKLELRQIRYEALLKMLALVMSVWLFLQLVFAVELMPDDMMSPALEEGDLMLFYRLHSDYLSGDVVMYRYGDKVYVGRIAARPGEEILITEEGKLVINGYVQPFENGENIHPVENGSRYPMTIGADEYFILSDNLEAGGDSRTFGSINSEDFIGKLITVLRRRNI